MEQLHVHDPGVDVGILRGGGTLWLLAASKARHAQKILKVAFMTFEVKDTKKLHFSSQCSLLVSSLLSISQPSLSHIYYIYSKVIEGTHAQCNIMHSSYKRFTY